MTRFVILRSIFWTALAFTFVMAVLPHPPRVPGSPSDKTQHVLAFATLSVLGTLAFRHLSFLRLFVSLVLFGIFIEGVQAIPALHREAEVTDILADMGAALIAGMITRALAKGRSS